MTSTRTLLLVAAFTLPALHAQEPAPQQPAAQQPAAQQPATQQVDKRVFGVLPNYRAADGNLPFAPITTRQKYVIGLKDSFDKPIYLLSAFYAGLGQLENSNPEFGQGMKGFGRRYIRGFADTAVGNILTEGVLPSALHEDPRYFLQGQASGRSTSSRVGYALTRVLVTKTDSGSARFNLSEWLGNAGSVGLSNAYYPGPHKLSSNLGKLGLQIGIDAASNVMKELWPDVKHKLMHR